MHQTNKKQTTRSNAKQAPRPSTSPKGEASLKLILDTAEKLMLDEGYAAVSSRRVAKEAGLKPPLVHYYFPTTDDLFLAVLRRAAGREQEKLHTAIESPDALKSLWATYNNQKQTALANEFMALANHRDAIKEEIAAMTCRERKQRAQTLTKTIDFDSLGPNGSSAEGLSVLLIAVARTLIMESGLGIKVGHDDARRLVEWWLEKLQEPPAK